MSLLKVIPGYINPQVDPLLAYAIKYKSTFDWTDFKYIKHFLQFKIYQFVYGPFLKLWLKYLRYSWLDSPLRVGHVS